MTDLCWHFPGNIYGDQPYTFPDSSPQERLLRRRQYGSAFQIPISLHSGHGLAVIRLSGCRYRYPEGVVPGYPLGDQLPCAAFPQEGNLPLPGRVATVCTGLQN